jgi:hypothetical protein
VKVGKNWDSKLNGLGKVGGYEWKSRIKKNWEPIVGGTNKCGCKFGVGWEWGGGEHGHKLQKNWKLGWGELGVSQEKLGVGFGESNVSWENGELGWLGCK